MDSVDFDPRDTGSLPGGPANAEFDEPLLSTHDESDADISVSYSADQFTSGEADRIENAAADNVLDSFIELVNARDFEAVCDLMAEDAEAPFLDATTAAGIAEGLGDLVLRYPTLVLTRGELGTEPIVATWIFHQDHDAYGLAGYFTAGWSDGDEPLIERLEYVEEFDDPDDLLVEAPEESEIPEGQAFADREQF